MAKVVDGRWGRCREGEKAIVTVGELLPAEDVSIADDGVFVLERGCGWGEGEM